MGDVQKYQFVVFLLVDGSWGQFFVFLYLQFLLFPKLEMVEAEVPAFPRAFFEF